MWPLSNNSAAFPRVPSDDVVPMHILDDLPMFRTQMVRQLLRYDEAMDVKKLHSSLLQLFERPEWRRIGARIRKTSAGFLEQHIPASFDEKRPPVVFTNRSHATSIGNHPLASQLPQSSATPAIHGNIRRFEALMTGPTTAKKFDEHLTQDIPQVAVHVESFNDATLISLSWTHQLSDGSGMQYFMQAWQAVLEGRHNDVLSPNSAEIDPMDKAGRGPASNYYMSSYAMSMWSQIMLIFISMVSWLWFGLEECRLIYIPGERLKKVHAQASLEVGSMQSEDGPGYISRHDTVAAIVAKVGSQLTLHPKQPVFLYQSTSSRHRLNTVSFPPDTALIGNFAVGTLAPMPAQEVRDRSVAEVAAVLRRTTQKHSQGDQMDSLVAMWRQVCQTAIPITLGRWNMHIVSCSNWGRGTSFEIDLSAARKYPTTNRTPLRASMALPFVFMENTMLGAPVSWLVGPDETGGYWVTMSMGKSRWRKAAKVFSEVGL